MIHSNLNLRAVQHPELRFIRQLKRHVPTIRVQGLERMSIQHIDIHTLGFKPWEVRKLYQCQIPQARDLTIWWNTEAFGWLLSESDQSRSSTAVISIQ
jgi:hypothetical protein